MATNTINADLIRVMFLYGSKSLESKKEWINELNVFPVPDGDTGTNMTMTIMSAAKEVLALEENDMKSLAKAISSGSLRGARGNSGVILSQLLRGFTKVVRDYEEVDIPVLADAFEKAVDSAYKAVMKPKEGTILTVAKGSAVKARELADAGVTELAQFIDEIIAEAEVVLAKTPDMLPVLKQAGVVDSGGQGLVEFMKGAREGFNNPDADINEIMTQASPEAEEAEAKEAEVNIKFGYRTAFKIISKNTFNIKMEIDFKEFLANIGDDPVCVVDGDEIKIDVLTNDPGLVIQRGLKYGQLTDIKIENIRLSKGLDFQPAESAQNVPDVPMEHKDYGFITVSVGEGMSEIFSGLGADFIIEGGQTMNPSTEDMLNAIDKVNADTIFILPNNKNIVLAANQAASLTEGKNVVVIPTKTVPQGITSIINFVPDAGVEENVAAMNEAIALVRTGQVTYAVRDTVIDDKEIKQGDYMGIGDSGILSVGEDLKNVTISMIDEMVDDEISLVSIYYGSDVSEEEANAISEEILKKHSDIDVEVQSGGQPIYYYVVSAE
ncbi:MAG: DAK2 domain-containing protein [Lachnospiraceae bacterium]|nr:DAK2 domain-containing protein [Lachnospiraceae bacterium]